MLSHPFSFFFSFSKRKGGISEMMLNAVLLHTRNLNSELFKSSIFSRQTKQKTKSCKEACQRQVKQIGRLENRLSRRYPLISIRVLCFISRIFFRFPLKSLAGDDMSKEVLEILFTSYPKCNVFYVLVDLIVTAQIL